MENKHFFYVVQCKDGSLYAGYTNHLERRIAVHNKGKGARYTRGRRPVTLVYYEVYAAKSEALKKEYAFKQLSRTKKEEYISKGDHYVAAKKFSQ